MAHLGAALGRLELRTLLLATTATSMGAKPTSSEPGLRAKSSRPVWTATRKRPALTRRVTPPRPRASRRHPADPAGGPQRPAPARRPGAGPATRLPGPPDARPSQPPAPAP